VSEKQMWIARCVGQYQCKKVGYLTGGYSKIPKTEARPRTEAGTYVQAGS